MSFFCLPASPKTASKTTNSSKPALLRLSDYLLTNYKKGVRPVQNWRQTTNVAIDVMVYAILGVVRPCQLSQSFMSPSRLLPWLKKWPTSMIIHQVLKSLPSQRSSYRTPAPVGPMTASSKEPAPPPPTTTNVSREFHNEIGICLHNGFFKTLGGILECDSERCRNGNLDRPTV